MNINAFLKTHGGYAKAKQLRAAGFHTRDIARLLGQNVIERVKPGLYRLSEISDLESFDHQIIDACMAVPNGVVCLASALAIFELTTFIPKQIQLAIPHERKPPKISFPPVKFFYFRARYYSPGIQEIQTKSGSIRIYEKEKSICDMFRYRKKLGEDLALESLRVYLHSRARDLKKLEKFADICHVRGVITPILKGMLVT